MFFGMFQIFFPISLLYFFWKVGVAMLLPEAIKLRIIELLDENDMSAYKLSYKGGIIWLQTILN